MPNEPGAAPQDIEKLRKRYKSLEEQQITAKANRKTSQEALDRLKQQARQDYGTDDLEELRKKLEQMKAENEQKRADYQRHLDEIERQLADVEQQHNAAAQKGSQQ
jgi:hypothetical protein